MSKVWTESDVDFALQSAWSAFGNTLKSHGFTEQQVHELIRLYFKAQGYKDIVDAAVKATCAVEQMEEE